MRIFVLLFILLSLNIRAQNVILNGIVTDKETGEKIEDAFLFVNETNKSISSNSFGFFSLQLPSDSLITITISYVGYKQQIEKLELKRDTTIYVELILNTQLAEIVVKDDYNRLLETPVIGVNSIRTKNLKMLPGISGENDILIAFQMLPGVQGGNEGAGALFVRGGNADQNLYLIDDVPIYYVNHLGGFISVFDENAINTVNLYKGGFPVQYSGKLSSIMDIQLKNGNSKGFHGEIKADVLASKIFIEGPLVKDRITMLLSVRRCNLDLITRTFLRENSAEGTGVFGYSFLDLNSKFNFAVSPKSALSVFTYYGNDRMINRFSGTGTPFESDFYYEELWTIQWGNLVSGLSWNFIPRKNLFLKSSIAYSSFGYNNELSLKEFLTESKDLNYETNNRTGSKIQDVIVRSELDYHFLGGHKIKFGSSLTQHQFSPISSHFIQRGTQQMDTVIGNQYLAAYENNNFVSYEAQIGRRFSFYGGVNFSFYKADSLDFANSQFRLNLNAKLNSFFSVKASCAEMTQFSHLLSNSNIGLPTDMWLPATRLAPPENAVIYSAAMVSVWNDMEVTLEMYHKRMRNLIDFKEASNFLQYTRWQDKLETGGIGLAYGLEFLVQKKQGSFTGWFSYSLSRSLRQFGNINSGRVYPSTYDRPHDVSLVLNYHYSKKLSFSANWVFSSGIPATFSTGHYNIQQIDVNVFDNIGSFNQLSELNSYDVIYFGERNEYRLPTYHRLDVAAIFTKKKTKGVRQIKLGLYNAYNHMNVFFVYYDYNYSEKKYKLYRYTLFPIIPSFSWSYVF